MSDVKISSNRSFGILFFLIFLAIALFPLLNKGDLKLVPLIISLVFLLLVILNSKFLTPLKLIWLKFGVILGKIINPLIMALIFFLVVTPTGLFMRLLKKDLLSLKFNDEKSYWIEKKGPKSQMKDQF
mgnify:FL=1